MVCRVFVKVASQLNLHKDVVDNVEDSSHLQYEKLNQKRFVCQLYTLVNPARQRYNHEEKDDIYCYETKTDS